MSIEKTSELADWIAVDWGTTNLRVWCMDAQGTPFAQTQSDQGMANLAPDEFEPALLALIAPHLAENTVTPVICAGMVGARQGWIEAAYEPVPCAPPSAHLATQAPTQDPRLSVFILPGLSQLTAPDVMRGEETQIAGALQDDPNFEGVLCLPGTHTKWVHIRAGKVLSFQTFMTGEMFDLLSNVSVLRHSTLSDVSDENSGAWDQASFESAVNIAKHAPHTVPAHLFGIRAQGLVADSTPSATRARLSGLMIGQELGAAQPIWSGQTVKIMGSPTVAQLYKSGLSQHGVDAVILDTTHMTLAGLSAAYQSLKGTRL